MYYHQSLYSHILFLQPITALSLSLEKATPTCLAGLHLYAGLVFSKVQETELILENIQT